MSGGDTPDAIRDADARNGEPGATDWTETEGTETDDTGPDGPAPADLPELETDPEDGQLPSDSDVQAERQP